MNLANEYESIWQHLHDVCLALGREQEASQKLIERNRELHAQLNFCVEALEELEDHDTQRDPCALRSIVHHTLTQLKETQS